MNHVIFVCLTFGFCFLEFRQSHRHGFTTWLEREISVVFFNMKQRRIANLGIEPGPSKLTEALPDMTPD